METTPTQRKTQSSRRKLIQQLPSAARFLDDVSRLIKQTAKGDTPEAQHDRTVADKLDRFVDYLITGKDIPPPPPAQVQPAEQAKAS